MIAKSQLKRLFETTRQLTESLCQPLKVEDYVIQSMEDVSPPKWHLAHTTWFFETFILKPHLSHYKVFNPLFHYLFNSYYQQLGDPYPRHQRGWLARPSVEDVYAYRQYVNSHLLEWLDKIDEEKYKEIFTDVVLGLQHEQQHQELLLMDIKYNFSLDPSFPKYQQNEVKSNNQGVQHKWQYFPGGIVKVGHVDSTFCFDNEKPAYEQLLSPYQLSTTLVTNAQYYEFIMSGGYLNPEWWLSDGWDCIKKERWKAPAYWHLQGKEVAIFTLNGLKPLDPEAPVTHVSFYEADAYARFRNARLPLESEWEAAAKSLPIEGNFLEKNHLHPLQASSSQSIQQLYGDVWEWTMSAYLPYPGYQAARNALGEYNGKFMSNQMVLRGGSCVTPEKHIRPTYRNFFQPEKRWQFSGIRLACVV